MIDIVLTQNASEALNGVFTIAFMGHVTPPFSHDVTPAEVQTVCMYSNNLVHH